jgi:DNA-binding NarL/FixJ family response regulator
MPELKEVLIIEDIVEVAQWLQTQILTVLPAANIKHCNHLASAFSAIEQKSYDLALVDLGLPDGDGCSFIQPFKAQHKNALCVITTIFDDAEHLFSALQAGADGYLLKDDLEQDFCMQLGGILNGRPPLSASIARRLLQQFRPTHEKREVTLTQRETDILCLIAQGLSVKIAAKQLSISPQTAAGYLKNVYRKLQVNSRAEATREAINLGLISSAANKHIN